MSERSKKAPNDGLFSPQNLRADRKAVITLILSSLPLKCKKGLLGKPFIQKKGEKRRKRRGREEKRKKERKGKQQPEKRSPPSTHIKAKTLPAVPAQLLCDYPALLRLVSFQVLAGTTNDSLAEPHDHWNTTTPLGCTPVGGMEVGKQAAAWLRDDATLFLTSLQKKELFPAQNGGLVKRQETVEGPGTEPKEGQSQALKV